MCVGFSDSDSPTRVVMFRRNVAKCFDDESQIVPSVHVASPRRTTAHDSEKLYHILYIYK